MNIVLIGPPGAGKGTQSDNILNNFNLKKVSTGDLLRQEVKNNSSLGKEIETILDSGSFVSDNIINNLIEKIIKNKEYKNRIIFDGYPRNINQAKNLDNILKKDEQKISCVLSIKVNKEIIIKRILGRIICSNCGKIFNEYFDPATKENHKCDVKYFQKRSDDNEKTILSRYDKYNKDTFPLLDYYSKQKKLREIDGTGKIDQIYDKIRHILETL